ncbi:MAG: flagellar protein FlaG [Burkholderiaceae bacterium]
MNIVVDQPSVNPAAASLAKVPASPAPASSMTPQALQSARAQGTLTPPRAPVDVSSPRAKLPTDAEKMVQQYQQVVDQLNRQMQADDRNLRFGVDRRINTFVITVTDKTSGDVVRQIPPEAVIRVAHSIEDLKGVLYNAKA